MTTGPALFRLQPPGHLEAADDRHLDVDEDDVWPPLCNSGFDLGTRLHLGHNVYAIGEQRTARQRPEPCVIVHEDDAQRHPTIVHLSLPVLRPC